MDRRRWEEIERLLDLALDLQPGERDAFLDTACAGDAALREQLLALLRADAQAGEFLHTPALDAEPLVSALFEDSLAGKQVGPYRIVREIGRGGMGVVYLAERADGQFQQQVALKLIKRGMDSDAILQRFLHERQILARLQHPNIARLLDGGITDEGQPYFAMERVDGTPLTTYCDQFHLGVEARLRLFLKACAAVQYAHQSLVVHRDLKPANMLVTESGELKLVDFGIAKVLGGDAGESPTTQLGSRPMTPEYASPEQLRNEPLTTAADVYALGVVLYELLSGHLPHDLQRGNPDAMARLVLTEPVRPSRAATRPAAGAGSDPAIRPTTPERVSRDRGTRPDRLRRRLAGDLDTICLKALQRDPERRYASVQTLRDDIERHLKGLPVLARPDTLAYRASRFVRRHRLGVASAAAVLLALVAGAIAATTFALREAVERRKAEEARADLEKVVQFQGQMISGVEPAAIGTRLLADLRRRMVEAARGGGAAPAELGQLERQIDRVLGGINGTDAALRVLDEEILGRAARVIEAEFAGEPLIEARLRAHLGKAYSDLGLYERARPHLERSLELRRRSRGGEHAGRVESLVALAVNHSNMSRFEEAEAEFEEAVESARVSLGPDHPLTLRARNGLGETCRRQARYEEAESLLLETLEARRRVLGPDDLQTVSTMEELALVYGYTSRDALAEPLLVEALAIRNRLLGSDHPSAFNALRALANNAAALGRLDDAEAKYLDLIPRVRRVRGSTHPDLLAAFNNLAGIYTAQRRLDDAASVYAEAMAISERTIGPDHFDTLTIAMNRASVELNAGRLEEAGSHYEAVLEKLDRTVGPAHAATLLARCNLGLVRHLQGRHLEASGNYKTAADNPRATAQVKIQAAAYFIEPTPSRNISASLRYAMQAVELTERGDFGSLRVLGMALEKNGRLDEAAAIYRETVALPGAGAAHFNGYAWFLLTRAPDDPSNAPTALEYALKANESSRQKNPDHLDTLALAYHRTGQSQKAVETVERALALVAPDDSKRRDPFLKRLEEFRAGPAGAAN